MAREHDLGGRRIVAADALLQRDEVLERGHATSIALPRPSSEARQLPSAITFQLRASPCVRSRSRLGSVYVANLSARS